MTMKATLALFDTRKDVILNVVPQTLRQRLTWESIRVQLAAELRKSQKLRDAKPVDVYSAALYIYQLGLEIGGHAQQAWLIPFEQRKKIDGKWVTVGITVNPMIGAQGKIEIAMRSGQIAGMTTQIVYENDDVVLDFINPANNRHRPNLRDRGEPLACYAQIELTSGARLLELMSQDDFDKIREAAKKKNRDVLSPAYQEWPLEMWRRSCLNRALKRAPKSRDLLEVLESEDAIARGGRLQARKDGRVDVIDADDEDLVQDEPAALPDHSDADIIEEATAAPQREREPVQAPGARATYDADDEDP